MSDLMEYANERAEGIGAPAGALEKAVELDTDKDEDAATKVSETPSKYDPAALDFHAAAVHEPIPIEGKAPVAKGWTSMLALSLDKAKARMAAGRNVGVPLRDTDLVIDVDPFVMTGGGGRHLYFRKPAEI